MNARQPGAPSPRSGSSWAAIVRFVLANKVYWIVPLVLAAVLLLVILLAPSPDVVPPFRYD